VNTTLLQSQLAKAQYDVSVAYDGEEGLNLVKKDPPDLIILDVEMPEMNGYTFMLELNKIEDRKSIPVIVLISHKESQPIFEMKGAKDYVT